MPTHRADVLIVGAGPAGLAAGAACRRLGKRFLLVELGQALGQRDHADQRRLGTGVGGSGLYSDGKFSFFPSATALWTLPDRAALGQSWDWLCRTLRPLGLEAADHPAPDALAGTPREGIPGGPLARKDYPSVYVDLAGRRALIQALEGECGESLLSGVELFDLRFEERTQLFRALTRSSSGGAFVLEARAVIYGAGRFGPVRWPALFAQGSSTFRRLEVGVRLEQPASAFFLRRDACLDPKLLLACADSRHSYRTFCCCREGEVVATEVLGIRSVSGRADCGPTGRSNVGFNLRVAAPELARLVCPILAAQGEPTAPLRASQSLEDYLGRDPREGPVWQVLGPDISELLTDGLRKLRDAYPALREAPCEVVAPAIEGVGDYPALSANLQARPFPLWVAGDATGLFRGLTAALVSGHYAALQARSA